eukprot:m.307629 g.307629  ORF g.307629 m.307629 type:complete len:451 (+) comp42553_c0_seq1:253-1605(+)
MHCDWLAHRLYQGGKSRLSFTRRTETTKSPEMPYGRDETARVRKHQHGASSSDDDEDVCCKPGGCLLLGKIDTNEMNDAVRVVCNNDQCTVGTFMHAACFDAFEQTIVNFLKGIGRARSWSDKQRRQNIWTKRGYDLAYKSCGCKCGKGYLKKDIDYQQPKHEENDADSAGEHEAPLSPTKTRRRRKKPSEKPALGRGGSGMADRFSVSPPTKAGVSRRVPFSPAPKDEDDVWTVATGSRRRVGSLTKVGFQKRKNLKSVQSLLPANKFNPMQIRIEDESHVTDDIKPLVHETLAANHASSIDCLVCARRMTVFDRYPLLDGTFYLSPQCDAIHVKPRQTYDFQQHVLQAVCVHCLVGRSEISCRACAKSWDGSFHQVGGVYSFDIFAASPCCEMRLACNKCHHPVVDRPSALPFFSDFSHQHQCPHCSLNDFHFVKPFENIFNVRVGQM